ncbi:LysM peptidoglycan-binding domain-containing protein [Spirosoma radiotolerans]|uniref:Peptidoglycan-binding protein n=1 Tax=Spirosoma radiotolerans TaxID=1379870 RepID=A0A0E3ZXG7_9BACT|nr:LysM peptidoglycan-binding domain-containing protein [Spirosoma radiotolerans]AKD56370.1 peptidoglycan-binding protein [Spirosoma radiotolerans]
MKKNPVHTALWLVSGILAFHALEARPTPPTKATVIDSIGIEKKEGKRFIIHRVDEGQTLYAIARRYGRSVAEIKAANPTLSNAVKYAELVRIPIPDGTLSRKEEKVIDKAIKKQEKEEKKEVKVVEKEKAVVEPKQKSVSKETKPEKTADKQIIRADDPAKAGIHVVEPRQTLYSLASRYGVSQADLRKWNNLPGNNVLIGQALIVSEKAYIDRMPSSPAPSTPSKPIETPGKQTEVPTRRPETEVAPHVPTRPADTHPTEPKSTTPAEPKTERPALPAPVTPKPTEPETRPTTKPVEKTADKTADKSPEKPVEEIEPPRPGNDAPMPTRGRRISSSGVAEMIEGNDGSGKYLALHRTAPIGTLVQVRNEFNNQSLWVKVIGRLPNTGVNDKILIKLSTQAFAKLSPQDRRFRAEVSYIVR